MRFSRCARRARRYTKSHEERLRADRFVLDGDGGHGGPAGTETGRRRPTSASSAPASRGSPPPTCSAREGKTVVVLDDGPVAGGETAAHHRPPRLTTSTTAFRPARGCTAPTACALATESHRAAVDRIEQIVQDEKIDCDFYRVDGYLFVSPERPGPGLPREGTRRRPPHRLEEVEWVERAPLTGFDTGRCLRVPAAGAVSPAQVPGRAGATRSGISGGARPRQHARGRRSRAARRRASTTSGGADGDGRRRRRRDQHAGERPRRHPHQAVAVADVRHRVAHPEGVGDASPSTGTPKTPTTTSACSPSTAPTTTC